MEQYAEAVASALAGNQEGYDFLYQSTYQKKFFIAKKYMGNDMDAQDVLQDAYVQAFTKLNTLQDYQKFPNWFGMIVANTAKNALQKKKMLFFSDLEGVNEEGEAMELNIMDTDASRQPEIAYTEKETQEMVHEMLDTPESFRTNFKELRRWVLEKAHKDIVGKTQLYYEWEPIKRGRAIIAVRFIFGAERSLPVAKKKADGAREKQSQLNNAAAITAMKCLKERGETCRGGYQKKSICDICLILRP